MVVLKKYEEGYAFFDEGISWLA